jgi:polyketide synthase PksL/polyketide synthase PksN
VNATVTVVEAHGTGTELGDPVEVAGLAASYGPSDAPACSLGTVKSMIGHGESVAGLAALTKVLLQIRHATLVPTLHADPVNPALRLVSTRFRLQHRAEAWQPLLDDTGTPRPRRAGISSFGAGGVNAHVIVEEYPGDPPAGDGPVPDEPQLFLLSGPTPEHVRATAGRLADWVRAAPAATDPGGLARIAYTLREGRAVGPCRLAVVAGGAAQLAEALAGDPGRIGDLRGAGPAHPLTGLPETGELLARLWQGGRLEVLGQLWLDGLDVVAGRPATGAGERVIEVPPSAMLRRPLWFTERDGLAVPPPPAVTAGPPAVVAAGATGPVPAEEPSTGPVPAEVPATGPAPAEEPATGPVAGQPEAGPDDPDGVAARVATLAAIKATGAATMIDLDRTLPEWGVDSINLTNLRFEIAQVFGVSIPLGELAERPFREISDRVVAHAGTAERGNAHVNGR